MMLITIITFMQMNFMLCGHMLVHVGGVCPLCWDSSHGLSPAFEQLSRPRGGERPMFLRKEDDDEDDEQETSSED